MGGGSMGDLDTETLMGAARSLERLRRLYWRCFFGMIALLVVFGAPAYAFEFQLSPFDRGVLLSLLGVGLLACLAGMSVAWFGLMAFCCPQCEEQFTPPQWFCLGDRCIHCGLDLGPAAVTDAKPPAEVDL